MAVVAEVLGDPAVDGRQSDLAFLAGVHGHTDERGVGVRRLHVRVGLVVHVVRAVSVGHDARQRQPAVGRGGGLPGGQWCPYAGGVPGQRRGGGIGVAACGGVYKQRPLVATGAQDGEPLEPLQTGQAVVQT